MKKALKNMSDLLFHYQLQIIKKSPFESSEFLDTSDET